MKATKENFPLSMMVSFKKLFALYRTNFDSENELLKERARQILAIAK